MPENPSLRQDIREYRRALKAHLDNDFGIFVAARCNTRFNDLGKPLAPLLNVGSG